MNSGLSTKNAPSPGVVIPYYIYSAFSLVLASIMMLVSGENILASFIGPNLLSFTHMLVLGWVSMVIFGALYQLIPVVMEVKINSEKMAHFSFWTLAIGNILLSFSFWQNYTSPKWMSIIGGSLVLLSIIVFVINFVATARTTRVKSTQNNFIITSVFWLSLTVALGIAILLNNKFYFMQISPIELLKAHAALGLIGWFLMLVMGVASILLPMFFIVHNLKTIYIKISYALTNLGLTFLVVSLLLSFPSWTKEIAGLMILLGVASFVRYNFDAYKNRLRKRLDIGMKLTVLSFLLLAASFINGLLVFLAPDFLSAQIIPLSLAFGMNLILGFFTSLILGQMYKTLPFILWLARYQDKVGKFKTPLPADLYSEKIANAHYYSFITAIILLNISLFVHCKLTFYGGVIALFITAFLYTYNTMKIVLHKENLKPLK
ncbi:MULTISPECIES: hypothetical protein [unclassified Lentimicrobium]|uniref:hypothetical protein n=1 Tax=unclassified Lentimicrobium TaxID=2677434 RepID=UPI001552BECA|nr:MULTISPECIES: hypothetical protein [unclassified Lentimicrobium]NPD44379.1 hypothetical protein [Lentimicrobium sp. S6]NPD86173.1 hypothetical protein [Lentimicrobium sp. L6]